VGGGGGGEIGTGNLKKRVQRGIIREMLGEELTAFEGAISPCKTDTPLAKAGRVGKTRCMTMLGKGIFEKRVENGHE